MLQAEWHDYVRKLLEDMEDNDGCIKPSTAQQLGESEAAASQVGWSFPRHKHITRDDSTA